MSRHHLSRDSALLSGAGLVSRILGLAREVLKSHFFGAGAWVSAFDAIFDLHTLMSDWLVGGLQAPVLIPTFTQQAALHETAWRRLLGILMVLYTLVFGTVALAFALAPRFFFTLVGGGLQAAFNPDLMRLMAPLAWGLGMQVLLSAALYARQRMLAPALAPALFNLVMIAVLLLGGRAGWDGRVLGLSATVGSLAAVVWLGTALRATPPLLRAWRESFPALRQMVLLSLPLLAATALDQLTVGLRLNLISRTGPSGIAWSKYATFVMQVPFSVAVLAVGIAVLPLLTQAALAQREEDVRVLTVQAMRLNLLLVLPCLTLGLVLAEPLVGVLYQHGAFTLDDTLHTAQVLRLLWFWLLAAAFDQPLNMAFYAHRNTLYPALANTAGVVGYIALALLSVALWGPRLLVLTAVFGLQLGIKVTLMLGGYLRRYGSLRGAGWSSAAQLIAASLAGGGVAWGLRALLEERLAPVWSGWLMLLLLAGGAGVLVYLALLRCWHQADLMLLLSSIWRPSRQLEEKE